MRHRIRPFLWPLATATLLIALLPAAPAVATSSAAVALTTTDLARAARTVRPGGVALRAVTLHTATDGAVSVTGTLDGAPFHLTFPGTWNHALVLFAHGYTAPGAGVSLSATGADPATRALFALAQHQGFAVAYSAYAKDGYAVGSGVDETDLLRRFVARLAPLTRTYLVGQSMGGDVVMGLIEQRPQSYAGALTYCGVVAGWAQEIRYLYDVRLIYDYFTRTDKALALPGAGHILPPDPRFNANSVVTSLSTLFGQAATTPAYAHLIAQIAAVSGAHPDLLSFAYPLVTGTLGLTDYLRTAGGNGYSNSDTVYHGSDNDRALNAGIERLSAVPAAAAYTARNYTPRGTFSTPLLSIHNLIDPFVPYQQETLLRARVAAHGNSAHLVQQNVDPEAPNPLSPLLGGPAHCYFTAAQLTYAWGELRRWSEGGVRPVDEANITHVAG